MCQKPNPINFDADEDQHSFILQMKEGREKQEKKNECRAYEQKVQISKI